MTRINEIKILKRHFTRDFALLASKNLTDSKLPFSRLPPGDGLQLP